MEDDVDDLETLEIFSGEPLQHEYQNCLGCGELVLDEIRAVWVKNGPKYSPFCDFSHRDRFYKQGLWKETLPPPLEIGD